jgi:hypothetical protein
MTKEDATLFMALSLSGRLRVTVKTRGAGEVRVMVEKLGSEMGCGDAELLKQRAKSARLTRERAMIMPLITCSVRECRAALINRGKDSEAAGCDEAGEGQDAMKQGRGRMR